MRFIGHQAAHTACLPAALLIPCLKDAVTPSDTRPMEHPVFIVSPVTQPHKFLA
jgi:hypothetical protein